MDNKKRNITGAYPGSSGAPQTKKVKNPAGSYPGKKAVSKREQPAAEPTEQVAEQTTAKRFRARMLFTKEALLQYRSTLIYYSCILVVSILLATWICDVGNELLGLIRLDREVTVTIEKDSSLGDVADVLADADIIDHPVIFEFYCKLKNTESFSEGDYTVNCKDDYNHIISSLKASKEKNKTLTFTVREGQTQEEIVTELCDSLKYLKREELENVLQNYDFSEYSFLEDLPARNYRLEGYLYPGEYEMKEGESALAVVERMLDRFEEQVLNEENKKLIDRSDYSLDELITLASILQKEGGKSLAKGAQVYFNRLESDFPYLQSQATVAYILPAEHEAITKDDIKVDDPYNTYRNEGLTPGPITNPGKAAIGAVLSPEETDAEFFVTGENGTMYFAESLSEHRRNMEKAKEPIRGTETVS